MKKFLAVSLLAVLAMNGCSRPEKEAGQGTQAGPGLEPFDSQYDKFKKAFESKDFDVSLSLMKSFLESFWERSPLLIRNIKFVKSADNSYGIYEPKESDAFPASEPLYLYLEPSGYSVVKNPEGYYEFGFTADFQIEDQNGKVLGGQNKFADMPFKSWNFNTEIALTFTFTFSGLEKGKYKVVTHVKDKNSEKKADVEKWFTIE